MKITSYEPTTCSKKFQFEIAHIFMGIIPRKGTER